jgi:hypothetical protein
MEIWPDLLPKPTVQGYTLQPEKNVLRTEMDSGPARQRRQFTQVPTVVTVRWRMNQEQLALFQSWFRWRAWSGASWFQVELLNGLGIQSQEARFWGPYKANAIHRALFWEITAKLEVRNPPMMSAGALDLLITGDNVDFTTQANRLHTLLHSSWPNHW